VPVTRFLTRNPQVAAGVTIRLVDGDPQSVVIRFFDDKGLDLPPETKRKIERLFDREDFRRVFAAEIGDIAFPSRTLEAYADALGSTVDLATVRDARFKLVVDYSFGAT